MVKPPKNTKTTVLLYKKLYVDLRKQFDKYFKRKRQSANEKYNKQWYQEVMERTKNEVKDPAVRSALIDTWKTLKANYCLDFDIISNCFRPIEYRRLLDIEINKRKIKKRKSGRRNG